MNTRTRILVKIITLSVLALPLISSAATASTLTLNGVGQESSQITVYGDPNSLVELRYGKYASSKSILGSTGSNGYLTLTISTKSYDIACGNTAYVYVNSQRSETISWTPPGNTTCATTDNSNKFSFSEQDIVLTIGQSKTVTMSGSGAYSITSNTSPVISASVSSNRLTLGARGFGGSIVTVCDSAGKCAAITVVALHSPQQCTPVAPTTNSCPVVTAPTTPTQSNTKHVFTLFLTTGDENAEVTELQKQLTALGYYSGPITGYFGSLTRAGVIRFQKANGIDQAGYVGPGTRAALNR